MLVSWLSWVVTCQFSHIYEDHCRLSSLLCATKGNNWQNKLQNIIQAAEHKFLTHMLLMRGIVFISWGIIYPDTTGRFERESACIQATFLKLSQGVVSMSEVHCYTNLHTDTCTRAVYKSLSVTLVTH